MNHIRHMLPVGAGSVSADSRSILYVLSQYRKILTASNDFRREYLQSLPHRGMFRNLLENIPYLKMDNKRRGGAYRREHERWKQSIVRKIGRKIVPEIVLPFFGLLT